MLSIEELTAALNDPTSPMREKLLKHLEQSPLVPAQAYQQVMQESGGDVGLGGMPNPEQMQGGAPSPFSSMLGTEPEPLGLGSFMPQPPDLSREANPLGVVNLANSAEVMPNLMPDVAGAGGAGGLDVAAMMKMFEGAGGVKDDYKPPQYPSAVAPRGNNWNTFTASQFQTPQAARMPTLSELLDTRRK